MPTDRQVSHTVDVKQIRSDGSGMAREDRVDFVRETLAACRVPLRSIDVFRACRVRGATFERRSTNTYLRELVDEGAVLKVDSEALKSGTITEIDPSERGHFIAASAAEEYRR